MAALLESTSNRVWPYVSICRKFSGIFTVLHKNWGIIYLDWSWNSRNELETVTKLSNIVAPYINVAIRISDWVQFFGNYAFELAVRKRNIIQILYPLKVIKIHTWRALEYCLKWTTPLWTSFVYPDCSPIDAGRSCHTRTPTAVIWNFDYVLFPIIQLVLTQFLADKSNEWFRPALTSITKSFFRNGTWISCGTTSVPSLPIPSWHPFPCPTL